MCAETHRTTEPDVQRPIQKSITQKLVQLSRGAPLGRSVSEEQGGLRATALASPRGPPAALSADRPGCLASASDQKARSDSAVETQALGPEATRAPSSARAPKGCAARPARRERRSPSRATADLVRAPRRPVPPAAVHTPGGLAPRLSSPGLPRPRCHTGLPETRPRAPTPPQPTHRNAVPAAPPTPTAAPPPPAASNPLTPKRKCGPRLSDPQPAAPLAAPRAVRQPPPRQSALGPQAAPGAGPCGSRSPHSFFLHPIRVWLTRGSGGAPSQSPLGKGGFMQIL